MAKISSKNTFYSLIALHVLLACRYNPRALMIRLDIGLMVSTLCSQVVVFIWLYLSVTVINRRYIKDIF
jgi:hypothetical protein